MRSPRLAERTETMGLCAFARADAGRDYDLVVRAFVGAPARFEDARVGCANATLRWLSHNDALPGTRRPLHRQPGPRSRLRCAPAPARGYRRRGVVRRPGLQRGARDDRLALIDD
jgi:predicted PhzF superfamily epimerase YddE/YHI9